MGMPHATLPAIPEPLRAGCNRICVRRIDVLLHYSCKYYYYCCIVLYADDYEYHAWRAAEASDALRCTLDAEIVRRRCSVSATNR